MWKLHTDREIEKKEGEKLQREIEKKEGEKLQRENEI